MNEYVAFGLAESMAIRPRPLVLHDDDTIALLKLADAIYETVDAQDRPLIDGHYLALINALRGQPPARKRRKRRY